MALKFFLFALLLVVSAQSLEAKSVDTFQERGISEEIQKLIEAARELVQSSISEIKSILKDLYESLQEQAQEQIKKAIEALRKVHEQAQEALEKLINEAGELAKEVKGCVDAKEQEIVDAYKQAQDGTQNCIESSRVVVGAAVNDARKVVETSIATLQELLNDFKSCEKITCQVGVVVRAIDAVPKIKTAVLVAAGNVREVVAAEVPVLAKCVGDVNNEYQQAILKINNEILQCVENIKN